MSLSIATLVVACASPSNTDDAESAEDALRRQNVDDPLPPKPKPPKPPVKPPVGPVPTAVFEPAPVWCGETRIDLRRVTRTCEDLPGVYQENGVSYLPGTGGRFKIERTLASTPAPEDAKAKTCTFTWQPATCGATPDVAKLLVESPTEQIVPRYPGCEYMPSGCGIITPPPQIDGGTPTGLGRCEVCGIAASDHMWAILPSGWSSFSYWAAGQRQFVQLDSSQDVYDVGLSSSVSTQNVTIYKYDSAPLQ